jgi:hypothetical protein
MCRPIPDRYHVFDMPSDELAFLLHRPEVANQPLQQRCFVASSFRNKAVVAELVGRLRLEGWFVYDFTAAELSLDERDWGGLSYAEAQAALAWWCVATSANWMCRSCTPSTLRPLSTMPWGTFSTAIKRIVDARLTTPTSASDAAPKRAPLCVQ